MTKIKKTCNALSGIDRDKPKIKTLFQSLDNGQDAIGSINSPPSARYTNDLLMLMAELAHTRTNDLDSLLVIPAFYLSKLKDAKKARATPLKYQENWGLLKEKSKHLFKESMCMRLS